MQANANRAAERGTLQQCTKYTSDQTFSLLCCLTASFGGVALDVSALLPANGQIDSLRIPFTCFARHGAQMAAMGQPLRVEADKGFVASIRSAVIEDVGEAIACPPLAR